MRARTLSSRRPALHACRGQSEKRSTFQIVLAHFSVLTEKSTSFVNFNASRVTIQLAFLLVLWPCGIRSCGPKSVFPRQQYWRLSIELSIAITWSLLNLTAMGG